MEWLDFSVYENSSSVFNAQLSSKGGYVTFSNSGKGGNKKYFTLSLESFLTCLKDIVKNHSAFQNCEIYEEKKWRDLGSKFFTDKAANAQSTVQTKPMFATLSKIIMWSNSPILNQNNPEARIKLGMEYLLNAINRLETLSDEFTPSLTNDNSDELVGDVIYSNKSIRDFAKFVFEYFYKEKWQILLNETNQALSQINGNSFISHDFGIFKRLIGEFNIIQSKENLTSSNTIRYFDQPIFIDSNKFYYFSTQWNGSGDYDLTFQNLKQFIEQKFSEYSLTNIGGIYSLLKVKQHSKSQFDINLFMNDLDESGLIFSNQLISRFIASLLTKPFVILTGLSGSGKTKLAQAFVHWICQKEEQFRIVPIGSDWTNREQLLGYPNALKPEEYIKPESGVLDLIIRANSFSEDPHFLILDEMNLSHVERYFSDFLSVMESKDNFLLHPNDEPINGIPPRLKLPSNLFIIGTVNIDETTSMFSPKVLDRANTIEFRVTKEQIDNFLKSNKLIKMNAIDKKGSIMAKDFLDLAQKQTFTNSDFSKINNVLVCFFQELRKTGAEFGYRSASEIVRLINQLKVINKDLTINEKLDFAIMQKLLPKLHGSRRKLCPVLETLAFFCIVGEQENIKEIFGNENYNYNSDIVIYPESLEKIARMYRGAIDNGFTSFAEA